MPWIFSLAFPIHIDIYIGSIPHCAKEFQIYTLLIWPYTEISFKIQKTENPTRVLRLVGVSLKDLWKSSSINGLQAASKASILNFKWQRRAKQFLHSKSNAYHI